MPVTAPLDTLALIDARAAAAYLHLRGWSLERQGELGDRWRHSATDVARNIALPHADLDDNDRSLMFSTALGVLEQVEQRSAAAITQDLRDADSDVVTFRLVAPELHDGNIPLSAAPELLTGAFEAIKSAGRAEVTRRAAFTGGQLPSQVKSFVDNAVVAPARKGSVILTIQSRFDASPLMQTSLVGEAERPDVPFERLAIRRLLAGIRAAKTAVHRHAAEMTNPDALDDDIEEGLSANLCDALTSLAGTKSELAASVSVGVRWSLFAPSDEPNTIVDIARNELGELPRIAQALRDIQPLEGVTLRGYVRNLDREHGQGDGTIRLNTEIDGRSAVVRLHLAAVDYDKALRAHSQDTELAFTGTLEKAGKIWEVTNPSDVSIG